MKFVLFCEGFTEKKALPSFLKKWLDSRLYQPVGIKTVRFEGWRDYVKDIRKKVNLHLNSNNKSDIIAAVGLLDLYGPTFYPPSMGPVSQRYQWLKYIWSKR